MSSCTWRFLLLLVVCVFCPRHALSRTPPNQLPHIVFIVADDLGWNDVGWREPKMHTPNLNFLALNGIILNNSYVQPLCSPSRSAFMSGYFPFHTGLQHDVIGPMQQAYLPANLTTLPEALKKVGYATHAVGKWHLGYCNWKYTPTYRGFDSFMGYYNAAEDYYTHKLGPGLDLRIDENVDTEDTGKYSAYFYAARAQQIIAAHNASQPLFLYLPFQSVHEPLEVPEVYENVFCSGTQNSTRKTKCGMVAILDEAIGNITGLLDTRGFMENILIIFTTDNGGPVWAAGNNWPLRGAKSTLWEGGTRGTGFVYSRNLFKQTGIIHDGLMHAVDWFPTIMSLVGGQTPPGIDGVSQWESILNGSPSPRYDFVYNIDQILQNSAIRNGDWKLIQGSPGTWNDWYPVPGVDSDDSVTPDYTKFAPDDYQLYNIKEDPEERNDVKSLYPDVLVAMQLRLAQWLNTEVPPNFPGPDPAANPARYGGAWSPGWC
ncbi:arylsulfatase B-like [Pomacea canaliculata]|uniref:arylsulfatase B-like n=1 Tax=Pomacea canaliculata TaxID=400727 RepID=UPI000D72F89D|nr:arylsulfatase B-like [Pomacea canaliculata]